MGRNLKTRLISGLTLITPGIASAEPSVSSASMIFLWVVAIALSVAMAWLITRGIVKLNGIKDKNYRWGVTIILAIVFAIFLAPFFVVFGSIFLHGRTM